MPATVFRKPHEPLALGSVETGESAARGARPPGGRVGCALVQLAWQEQFAVRSRQGHSDFDAKLGVEREEIRPNFRPEAYVMALSRRSRSGKRP